jgi:hypothetical protein
VEQLNHVWNLEIEIAGGDENGPEWSHPLLVSPTHTAGTAGLLDLLRDFKAQSPLLERLELAHIADNRYSWYFRTGAPDGREWLQEIRVADPVLDTEMNFNVPDFWAMRELIGLRGPMLQKVVELANAFPAITKIEAIWL